MSTKLFAVSSLLLLAQIYGISSHPQPDSNDEHNTYSDKDLVHHPYDKIELTCKNHHNGEISWSFNNSQLPDHVLIKNGDNSNSKDAVLIIPSANFSDSGTYECKSDGTLLQKYSIDIIANNSISLRGSSSTNNCSFTCNVTNYVWSSKGSNDEEDQFNCTSENGYSKTNFTFYVKRASELKDQKEVLDCEYTDVKNKGNKFVINASSNLSSIEVQGGQHVILDDTYSCKKVSSGTANLCASFTIILGLIAFVFVKNN